MGYDNFGFKIGVEGEKEFKSALQDIRQTFKVLGSEMNLVSSEFDKQDKSVQAVTARNSVLNKEIDSQKDKISTLEKALKNAATSFGENDKRTQSWTVQLNNAKAELNGMEKELSQSNSSLSGTGKEFNSAETQANQFGDEVKRAADKSEEAGGRLEKLGGVIKGMGAAMGVGIAAVGAAGVAAVTGAKNVLMSSIATADGLQKQSDVTGMSVETLQEYTYAGSALGVELDTITGAQSKLIKNMASADTGSKSQSAAFKTLGVDIHDMHGNLRDSQETMGDVFDALGKIENPTQRDALAMQIFGKSARDLNPLIKAGSAGLNDLSAEAKKNGAIMSTETVAGLDGFGDSLDAVGLAAKGMVGTMAASAMPMLDEMTSLFGDLTGTLNLALKSGDFDEFGTVLSAGIGTMVTQLTGAITKAMPVVSKVLSSVIGAIADAAPAALPALIAVGIDIITTLGGAILSNLPLLIDSAVQIVMTLFQALIAALPQITAGALQLVLALVDGIIANLPALVGGALQMIVALASGIGDALPTLIPAIINAVLLIVDTLINNMDKILAAAFKIIEGLAKGLIIALPQLVDKLPQIIDSLVNFLVNNLPLIIAVGFQIIVALAGALVKAIPQLVSKLPQIITSIVNGFGNLKENMNAVGTNIVTGLWEGIKGMGSWIQGKVSDFFSGIVDNVKGVLGIHSPSTVFAGIGGYMAQGLGAGFSKAMDQVSGDIQAAIPTNFDLNTSVSANAIGGAAKGNGIGVSGFTLHIENFVNNTEKDIERLAYEFEFYRQRAALATGGA